MPSTEATAESIEPMHGEAAGIGLRVEIRRSTQNCYLVFCRAGAIELAEEAYLTGANLITRCLEQIATTENPGLFLLKLFLPMVTPVYLECLTYSRPIEQTRPTRG